MIDDSIQERLIVSLITVGETQVDGDEEINQFVFNWFVVLIIPLSDKYFPIELITIIGKCEANLSRHLLSIVTF